MKKIEPIGDPLEYIKKHKPEIIGQFMQENKFILVTVKEKLDQLIEEHNKNTEL